MLEKIATLKFVSERQQIQAVCPTIRYFHHILADGAGRYMNHLRSISKIKNIYCTECREELKNSPTEDWLQCLQRKSWFHKSITDYRRKANLSVSQAYNNTCIKRHNLVPSSVLSYHLNGLRYHTMHCLVLDF